VTTAEPPPAWAVGYDGAVGVRAAIAIVGVALAGCLSVPEPDEVAGDGGDGACTPVSSANEEVAALRDDFASLDLADGPWSAKGDGDCAFDNPGGVLEIDASEGNRCILGTSRPYDLSCGSIAVTYVSGVAAYLEAVHPAGDRFRFQRHESGEIECRVCSEDAVCDEPFARATYAASRHARWRLVSRDDGLHGETRGDDVASWQPFCDFDVDPGDLIEVTIHLATSGADARVVQFDDVNR
jgi:hypothetical protein